MTVNIARRWTAAHPALAFVVFVLAWSWGMWSLLFLFIGPGGLLHGPPPVTYLFVVLGGLGPSLGGVLLTGLIDGRAGLYALRVRLSPRGVGAWWWALLLIPFATAVTPLLRWMTGHDVGATAMPGLIVPALALGLLAGLMEEGGWRGFLLPRLLARHGALTSALAVGLIWGGLWHGYADYFGLGDRGWAFWPLMLLLGPVLLTAWSLVLTWTFERTNGNLLLAILMHASISSSALLFGQKFPTLEEELVWTSASVAIAWGVALFVWFGARRVPAIASGPTAR